MNRWLIATIALATADVVTTIVGLNIGMLEANPFAAGLLGGFGILALPAMKVASIATLLLIFRRIPKAKRIGWPLAVGLSITPVVWNTYLLTTYMAYLAS